MNSHKNINLTENTSAFGKFSPQEIAEITENFDILTDIGILKDISEGDNILASFEAKLKIEEGYK